MPNEAPYKIKKDGDKFAVVNNAGATKSTFKTYGDALKFLRALYANVPGAAKRADKVKWTGKQKRPVKAELDPATLDRLRQRYQLAEAALTPADPTPAGYDAETQVINRNKDTVQARQPHPFQPAVHLADENAQRRCLMCGMPEPANGECAGLSPDSAPKPMPDMPHGVEMMSERAPKPVLNQQVALQSPGFVTELNGKTIVTAQASTDPALFEKAFTPNEHFLWTQGRLVGADEPNRNGAFWSSGDLELGQATVKYGPLNWLHDGKHVIGTLAEAAFLKPEGAESAAFAQPHIAVVAPVWKWLYPDEASVIEMASDAEKFWYSMECVSKSVQCAGENGCGTELAYMDYIKGNGACSHMQERSAVRRFVDPTFLGAAVIVPPVRPGWADANATAMTQAAALAEKAYESAGRPNVAASDWEQLMAQVVKFATT